MHSSPRGFSPLLAAHNLRHSLNLEHRAVTSDTSPFQTGGWNWNWRRSGELLKVTAESLVLSTSVQLSVCTFQTHTHTHFYTLCFLHPSFSNYLFSRTGRHWSTVYMFMCYVWYLVLCVDNNGVNCQWQGFTEKPRIAPEINALDPSNCLVNL